MTLKLRVIPTISETCIGESMTKKGYQHRTRIVKDEKGDLVTESHSTLARWRKYFLQLPNVRRVNDVRHTVIQTAEPLVPKHSDFEFEMAIEKLKRHKLPGVDQIPAEKQGVEQFSPRSINLLILLGIRRNCLRSRRC